MTVSYRVIVDMQTTEHETKAEAVAAFDAAEPAPYPAPVPYRALINPTGRTIRAAFPGGADLSQVAGLGLPVQ